MLSNPCSLACPSTSLRQLACCAFDYTRLVLESARLCIQADCVPEKASGCWHAAPVFVCTMSDCRVKQADVAHRARSRMLAS